MKRILILMITFAMVICMSLTAMAEQNQVSEEVLAPTTAIVATKSSPLSLRETPEQNGVILCEIPKGATVTVLEKGDWPKVEYNGKTGFVNGRYLQYNKVLSADAQAIVGSWRALGNEFLSFELNSDGAGEVDCIAYDSQRNIGYPVALKCLWTLDGEELTIAFINTEGSIYQQFTGNYKDKLIHIAFADKIEYIFLRQDSQK